MTAVFSRRLLLLLLSGSAAGAKVPVDPVNGSGGLAIKGYDVIAYFDAGEAVKGSKEHTYEWNGAKWRFSSAANMAKFQAAPEKFAPQFGGYCAYAVSENYTADVDPQAWTVRGGKLYLNYSKSVQKTWLETADARIAAGEKNWPGLHR